MSDLSRRELVRRAALLACLPPALEVGCARRISAVRSVTVAAPVDGVLLLAPADAPELGHSGGAVLVRAPGLGGAYLVARTSAGALALSGICPHAGCELTWVAEDREAECPCHGSRFAGDGSVLSPPARADLRAYPVELLDASGTLAVRLYAGDGVFQQRVRDGQVSFPLAEFPALTKVGGVVQGRPDGFPSPLVLSRVAESGPDALAAVSAICSHLGCSVLPQPCAAGPTCSAGAQLQCPCHGSRYELTGRFLAGPAAGTDLLRYGVAFDGTTVTISTTPKPAT